MRHRYGRRSDPEAVEFRGLRRLASPPQDYRPLDSHRLAPRLSLSSDEAWPPILRRHWPCPNSWSGVERSFPGQQA